jgi:NAD(P)-dependent dehydrogenase (short-subunit alcohol dehydrogenase family)
MSRMPRGLKPVGQQVVVLIGASSGIGRAAALRFARHGARLVIAARSSDGLASLAAELRSLGAPVVDITADAASPAQMQAVAARAVAEFGRIDTWVHLAGVALYAPVDETAPDEFRQVIEVNLLGQVYGAMAALPHLKREGRGALIHISSVLGERGVPLMSSYCASKHGLNGFLESLRGEIDSEGLPINVANIMPSSINSTFYNKAKTKLGVMPAPIPPVYDPETVVDAILYAAQHPVRDLVVGGGGQALIWGQRLSPGLTDAFVQPYTLRTIRSQQPKTAAAPNNLFEPIEGQNRVRGDFGSVTRRNSIYTALETGPLGEALNAAGDLVALAAVPALSVASGALNLLAGGVRLFANTLELLEQGGGARRAAEYVDRRVDQHVEVIDIDFKERTYEA